MNIYAEIASLALYFVAFRWMEKYDVPFWPAVGIGSLIVIGTKL